MANLGHFNLEVAVNDLEDLAIKKRRIGEYVDEYTLPNGNRIFLIAEGRLANLVVLGGHPPEIMDLSFSVQALTAEYLVKNRHKMDIKVHNVPEEIDKKVATVKLEAMNIHIDTLLEKQKAYIESFNLGT